MFSLKEKNIKRPDKRFLAKSLFVSKSIITFAASYTLNLYEEPELWNNYFITYGSISCFH